MKNFDNIDETNKQNNKIWENIEWFKDIVWFMRIDLIQFFFYNSFFSLSNSYIDIYGNEFSFYGLMDW